VPEMTESQNPADTPAGNNVVVLLRDVHKSFANLEVLKGITFEVKRGEVTVLIGPSGSGKSTALRCVDRLEKISQGYIEVCGHNLTAPDLDLRKLRLDVGIVFQSYNLFPHLTVAENIAFGLALKKRPRDEIALRTRDALSLVRLDTFGGRMIDRLSGGQQQRVALARALIMRPKVLLLDEPLAALDLKLRHQMQEELRRIHQEIGGTFIFVTHDQSEAFGLANQVAVMNAGRVEQIGSPGRIYLNPETLFVADFVGETTLLEGERRNGRVRLKAGREFDSKGADGAVRVVVRPERVRVRKDGIKAVVADAVFFGSSLKVSLRLPSDEILILRSSAADAAEDYKTGKKLTVGWDIKDQQVIDMRQP
jgi:ABC-type Fe3+/spermidine/putrescine transport system ATPase subunit